MPRRTTVVCGSASNAVVAHAEVCTPLDAWISRAVASTRPPSTFFFRVSRRRADAVSRQYSSILATFQFRTIHFSLFTKSAMARRVIITSAPGFHYCPLHVSVLSSTLSTLRFRTRTIHFSLFTKSAMARRSNNIPSGTPPSRPDTITLPFNVLRRHKTTGWVQSHQSS